MPASFGQATAPTGRNICQGGRQGRRGYTQGPLSRMKNDLPRIQCRGMGRDVLEERGEVWNPKVWAPKIAHINMSFSKFRFFHYEIWVQGG